MLRIKKLRLLKLRLLTIVERWVVPIRIRISAVRIRIRIKIVRIWNTGGQWVDPKLLLLIFFFSDPDPTLTLISDPDSDRIVYEKYIWNADHLYIAKKQFFWNLYIFGSGLFRKMYFNCRSSKHCKKANFLFLSVHFYSFVFVSWKQNLTLIRNRIQN